MYMKKKAVIWLAKKLKKPITSLVKTDYEYNGLYELIDEYKNIRDLNNEITEAITN